MSGRRRQAVDASLPRLTVIMPMTDLRGGAERALLAFLEGEAARSAVRAVVFLETSGPLSAAVSALGYDVHHFPVPRLRNGVALLRAVVRTAGVTSRNGSNGVLTWMTRGAPVGSGAALLGRLRHVLYQHGWTGTSLYEQLIFRMPLTGVLVCSRYCQGAIMMHYPGIRTAVVWPGLSTAQLAESQLSRDEARAALGLNADDYIVGTVARLQEWKGVHLLIEAATRLRHEQSLRLCVVGGAPPGGEGYVDRLRYQIDSLGLADVVQLVGHDPHGSRWIAAFDVFVHTAHGEPFGLVIAEALAASTPVVAAHTGGPEELLAGGEYGLIVDPTDPDELAGAIQASSPGSAEVTARTARAALRSADFTPDAFSARVVAELSDLWRQAMGQSHPRDVA